MDDAIVTAAIVGAGLIGLTTASAVSVYIGRMAIRHERRLAYLGFAAALTRIADGIGADSDPRRVAASLRLQAGQARRIADALRANNTEGSDLV